MHFSFLSRSISSNPYNRRTHLGVFGKNAFLLFNSFSSKPNDQLQLPTQEDSHFTVSYLINSCGLCPKSAIKASKTVRFENPENPNSVLNFFKQHGFSETQVSKIIKYRPGIIVANPEKTLLPKIKFLQSIGVSSTNLPKLVVSNPVLLLRSLDECLIPRYEILKSVLSGNEEVIKALRCTVWCLRNVLDDIVPNMKLLRELGVPQRFVSLLVTNHPDVAFVNHTKFAEAVKLVKEMEFDPKKSSFVKAVQVLTKLNQYMWEAKLEAFERWGWSRDMTLLAFKKFPNCMLCSEKKIAKVLGFLANEMGIPSEYIAETPMVLSLSLEKRIIPRCLVIQDLKSKGLIKNDLRLCAFLTKSEKHFLNRFVARFQGPDDGQIASSGVIIDLQSH